MRLGERLSQIVKSGSITEKLYMKSKIFERHRHRYEINPKYVPQLAAKGLKFIAIGAEKQGNANVFLKNKQRMEVIS